MMSRGSSSPTDRRSIPSVMPISSRTGGGDAGVGGRRRVGHQRPRVAEVVRDVDQLRARRAGACACARSSTNSAMIVPPPLHLAHREVVLRMAGEARIEQSRHAAVERGGDGGRVLVRPADAEVERLEALEHDPRVERAEHRAGVARHREIGVGDPLLRAEHRPGEHPPLPVHRAWSPNSGRRRPPSRAAAAAPARRRRCRRRRVAPASWPMSATAAMSTMSSAGFDGVSRKNAFVFGRRAFAHASVSRPSTTVVAMPKRGRMRVDQHPARAEQRAAGDEVVARRQMAQQRGRHRRHAGRRDAARLRPFEQAQPLLEHHVGRVLQPRIGHARALAAEARGGLLGIVVGIARGEEDRLRRLAEFGPQRAAAHRLRRRVPCRGDGPVVSCAALHGART